MGDSARSDHDRLPWLDAPRPVTPLPAARRARTPLLVLLGLFLASAIAVMAFLTGRSTAPVATAALEAPERPAAPVSRVPDILPMPLPTAPIRPSPSVTTPAAPVDAVVATAPATPRAVRPKASVRRSAERSAQATAGRDTPLPTPWSAQPFAGPPGRVIQVGSYATQAEADAAWWRLARSYPYLGTLPRVVTPTDPAPGASRSYQIRLSVGSRRAARSVCENLHRNRRGCIIDWSQK